MREIPRRKGIKIHFGASDVDVRDPDHVVKLKRVFVAANRNRLAIIARLLSRRDDYGRQDAEIFLSQVVPAAPEIVIQIAHMAGSGPGLDAGEAMQVYIKAIAARDPLMKNLYFDVASTTTSDATPKTLDLIARTLRQIGLKRILFASDRYSANDTPKVAWRAFRELPLTDEEFQIVATNVAPYVDDPR